MIAARAGTSPSSRTGDVNIRFSRPVLVSLAAVCLASAVVVVVLGTRLTFFNDDWYFLLQRPGLESGGGVNVLLAPHNGNLVFLTAGLYKLVVAVFGLSWQLPFRIVLAIGIAAIGVLVFAIVSRSAGQLVGLASASVVVLLGPAWEDLLFFASIDLVGSLATGLAAVWLIERDQPRWGLACFMLTCSVGFSNLGVPFAVGAAAAILLRRSWARLWVAVVPLAVFGLWWALDGSSESSALSGTNVEHLPQYILNSVSCGLASLAGLSVGTSPGTESRGHIILALVAAVIAIALARGWRPRREALVPAVIALGFWCLTGASFIPGREPFASRYQLIDVVLLLLLGAALVGVVRLGKIRSALLLVVTAGVVASNVAVGLAYGYRFLTQQSEFVKTDLGALTIGRRLAPPKLMLLADVANTPFLSGVTAARFFAETDAHGRVPVYDVAQIMSAPAAEREGADHVLAVAERLNPSRTTARLIPTSRCATVRPGASGRSELPLTPGTWLFSEQGGSGLAIGVRRFAPSGYPAYIGLIAPGLTERTIVPADPIPIPWKLSVTAARTGGSASLRACRA